MIDFSKTDDANTTGQTLLPEGDYLAVGDRAELDSYNGKDQLKASFRIVDGDHEGRLVFDDLYLTQKALFRVKQLLASNGALAKDFKGSLDPEELPGMVVGREVVVRVYHDTYNDKTRARINRYIAPSPTGSPF